MKQTTRLLNKNSAAPVGENVDPNMQQMLLTQCQNDADMKDESGHSYHSHKSQSNFDNNVSGFFGQNEQPIQDQCQCCKHSSKTLQTPQNADKVRKEINLIDSALGDDDACIPMGNKNLDLKFSVSGQNQISHKNIEEKNNTIMIKSSESKKEKFKLSETSKSLHESNGDDCLKCVETVHFQDHQARLKTKIQPEQTDLKMQMILPSTPRTSSQKKSSNQVNVDEIVNQRQNCNLHKKLHSGQKDLLQQAEKFLENIPSPIFPQQDHIKIKMPFAVSPNRHVQQGTQKTRFEAISNNTENKLNQVSAQVLSKNNQNSHGKLRLEKQISFAVPCQDLLSPKPRSKSPFGSHAKFSQRIDMISPKAQKDGNESPGKGLQGMPIINRGSQIKNRKDSSFVGFMMSPSPNKRNGSPSLVASSSKGRQLFLSPDEGKNTNGPNVTPSAAKRYDGSSNTPKQTIMYETKNRSSTITSNFKLARNSVRKTISQSKQDISVQRELSNIKKLNYGEVNLSGVNSNNQTQEARYTQQIMGGPSPTFFGGNSSNSLLQQQLFQKHQNGLNCPPVLYSPAFMTSEARNPYMPTITQNQYASASFGYRGEISPGFKKNNIKSSIISSKFTVGRENGQGRQSDRKSSAKFLSSYKKKGRSNKKRGNLNDTTIKIDLNPNDIVSPDKIKIDSQSGRFVKSSKQDKSNSNMKSSGSGSYTSDSQSSSGIQSSSAVSSDNKKFYQFNMDNGLFQSALDPSFAGYNQNMINQMAMMNQMHPLLQQLNYRYQVIQELQNNMHFHCIPTKPGDVKCTCPIWKEQSRAQKDCRSSCDKCDSDCSQSKRKINFYHQPAEIIFNQTNVYNTPHYTSITQGDQSNVNFNPQMSNQMMQFQQNPLLIGGNGIQMPFNMQNQEGQFFQSETDEVKKQKNKIPHLGKRQSTGQNKDPKNAKRQKVENPESHETPDRNVEQNSHQSSENNHQNSKKRSKKERLSTQKSLSKNSKPNNQVPSNCDADGFERPSGFPFRPDSKNANPTQQQSDSFQQTPQKDGKTIAVADAQVSLSQVRTTPFLATGVSGTTGNNDTNRNPRTPGSLEKMAVGSFNLNIGDNNQAVSADKIRIDRQNPNKQTFNVFATHFNIDNEQMFGLNSNTAQYDGNSGLQLQKNSSTAQKVKAKKNDQTKLYPGQSTRRSIIEKEAQQKQKEEDIEKKTLEIMDSTKTQDQLFEQMKQKDPNAPCAGCKCKNNQCLKLYCVCLANNSTCGPACQCTKLLQNGCCKNTPDHSEDRRKAIVDILGRNINAFKEKVNKADGDKEEHRTGCNCKKSKCQKNYCECFERGLLCNDKCKCENCHNRGPTKCQDNHHHHDGDNFEKQQAIQNMAPSPNFPGNTNSFEKKVEIKIPDSIDKIDLKLNNSIIKADKPAQQQFQSRQFKLDEEAEPLTEKNQDKIIALIERKPQENKQIIQKPISKIKIEQDEDEKVQENSLQTFKQEKNQQINNEEKEANARQDCPLEPIASNNILADPLVKDKKEEQTKDKKAPQKKQYKKLSEPRKKEGIVTRSRNRKQPQDY